MYALFTAVFSSCSLSAEGQEFFTSYDEVYESFDSMGLQENLLRGIYAYGIYFVSFFISFFFLTHFVSNLPCNFLYNSKGFPLLLKVLRSHLQFSKGVLFHSAKALM